MELLTPEQMDTNAQEARKELLIICESGTVPEVADWWRRWYWKAGYKRLARLLMAVK